MRLRCLPIAFVCLSLSTAASAEPSEAAVAAARELADEGGQLFLDEKYAEAVDKLSKAYAVVKVPTLAFHLGHALELSGRWVEAAERYRETELMPTPDKMRATHEEAQAKAKARREALLPRIPHLAIRVTGAELTDVTVTVDGSEIPTALLAETIPVDPGQHVVVATRGDQRIQETRTVAEGELSSVTLTLPELAPPPPVEPAPPPPPPPAPVPTPTPDPPPDSSGAWMTPVGWIALGLGGAGLIVGTITGAIVLDKDAGLDCPDNLCLPSQADDVDTINSLGPVTTISLVAGGVLAAAGITLLIIAPSEEATIGITPSGASVRVQF